MGNFPSGKIGLRIFMISDFLSSTKSCNLLRLVPDFSSPSLISRTTTPLSNALTIGFRAPRLLFRSPPKFLLPTLVPRKPTRLSISLRRSKSFQLKKAFLELSATLWARITTNVRLLSNKRLKRVLRENIASLFVITTTPLSPREPIRNS